MANTSFIRSCRLCLSENNDYNDIYESSARHGFHIADVINELLDLNVQPGDRLPGFVCHNCLSEVARFKCFKKVCHKSKVTLEYNLTQNEIEMNSVVKEENDNFEAVDDELNLIGSLKKEITEEPPERRYDDFDENEIYQDHESNHADNDGHEETEVLISERLQSSANSIHNFSHSIYQCLNCAKVFPNDITLQKHSSLGCRPANYCSHCNITIEKKWSFEQHMSKYHKESHSFCQTNEQPLLCELCGKYFKLKSSLRLHKSKFHSQRLPYSCTVCLKTFSTPSCLKYHAVNHSNDRPHVCHICGNKYKRKHKLKNHYLLIHMLNM